MKKLLFFAIVLLASKFTFAQDGLPANPKPGSCYVRCITHDEFKTVEEKILVKPAYSKLEIVPATYKVVEEKVMVKEATKKYIYVPAVYETVDVPFVSKASRTDLSVVPATFSPGEEKREIYPAVSGWEVTTAKNCKSLNPSDCQALCFVDKPNTMKTISIEKLAADASTKDIPVAEKQSSYKKQVIKTSAKYQEIDIPAEYSVIKKEVIDRPASTKKVTVPAVYTTITKTELAKKGTLGTYTEIDCKLVSYNPLPILYDLGSAALTPAAKKIIDDNLLNLLRNKTEVSVEIASHTDSRSDDAYNMNLSQRRAESVVNYLVSKGIKRSRLVAKGYGETRLTNQCGNGVQCTEQQHQANRRTEFRVINAM